MKTIPAGWIETSKNVFSPPQAVEKKRIRQSDKPLLNQLERNLSDAKQRKANRDRDTGNYSRQKKFQNDLRVEINMTIKPSADQSKLNKTEQAYFQYLKLLGFVWIGVQNITLKLADDTRFTPDFSTIDENGNLRFIDVKGFQREDALIKIKVAARLFPFAEFVIVKKAGKGWDHNYLKP